MRILWRTALPLVGLALFTLITYQSVAENRKLNREGISREGSAKYFWWSSIRLDSDPQDRNHHSPKSVCTDNSDGSKDCVLVEPLIFWIDPGWPVRGLIIAAFPAFLISAAVVRGFSRMGISEVRTFLICTPILISGWFYSVAWFLDRRRIKRISAK